MTYTVYTSLHGPIGVGPPIPVPNEVCGAQYRNLFPVSHPDDKPTQIRGGHFPFSKLRPPNPVVPCHFLPLPITWWPYRIHFKSIYSGLQKVSNVCLFFVFLE